MPTPAKRKNTGPPEPVALWVRFGKTMATPPRRNTALVVVRHGRELRPIIPTPEVNECDYLKLAIENSITTLTNIAIITVIKVSFFTLDLPFICRSRALAVFMSSCLSK